MIAAQVMQTPVYAASPRALARDIAGQLVMNGISGMPVAESDGVPMGIVTEADILRMLRDGAELGLLTAEDVMTRDPITVDVSTPLEVVIGTLEDNGVLRVPVTNEGKLVGTISRRDIIEAVLDREFLAF
jgi:CBS domain-containing protein